MYGVISVARKETYHLLRDRRTLGFVFFMPIMFLIILGTAISGEIYNISWIVWDLDRSESSRGLIEKIARTTEFNPPRYVQNYDEIEKRFMAGTSIMAVIIPSGFASKSASDKSPQIQILINGSDPTSALPVMNYVNLILMNYQYKIIQMKGFTGGVDVRDRYYFNPRLKGYPFFASGLIGLLITQVGLILAAMSIVGEKENGTMELLLTSPVPSWQIIVGKLLPYLVLSFWDIFFVIMVAIVTFGLIPQGSLALLMFLSIFFVIGNLAAGLTISTYSETQQQAVYMVMFYMMPTMLLSGYLYPIISMPSWVQTITYILPLRYYLVILRGIIIKGVGFTDLYGEFIALLIYSSLMVIFSSLRFRKIIA